MAHYPESATGLNYVSGPVGPTAAAQQVTCSTVHTKGSYAQLVSSLGFTSNSVIVIITRSQATAITFLTDIATGPGGSETVVIPNLLTDNYGSVSSHLGSGYYVFPLAVASGTRIAARTQSNFATGQDVFVSLTFSAAGDTPGCSTFVNYGANTSTTRGVSVDSGGTANTKGSYSQLTASTSGVSQVIVPSLSLGGNGSPTAAQWAVDIATGAGGAETVLIPDIRLGTPSATGSRIALRSLTFLTYIAASTRIAARSSCDITDATDRLLDVAVLVATAGSNTHYPQSTTGLNYATYPVGPAGAAQQISSHATNHTKGSYAEMAASLGFTANNLSLVMTRSTGATSDIQQFLDVATGAAGFETVVVPNLLIDNTSNTSSHLGASVFELPLAIASGTRVAVRSQSDSPTAMDIWLSMTAAATGSTAGCASFVNYGVNTTTTNAVVIDPGGTANTKGSYVEITTGTTEIAQVIVPILSVKSNSGGTAAQWALDVATGAGGAETVLIPDIRFSTASLNNARFTMRSSTFLTYIASGTRIATRVSCDNATLADRTFQMSILIATAPSEAAVSVERSYAYIDGIWSA